MAGLREKSIAFSERPVPARFKQLFYSVPNLPIVSDSSVDFPCSQAFATLNRA